MGFRGAFDTRTPACLSGTGDGAVDTTKATRGQGAPNESQIKEQLKAQGIENFGQLVSEVNRQLKDRGEVDALRWYLIGGSEFVLVVSDPS
jgi:hypothetical protein